MSLTKRCSACGDPKPRTAFYADRKSKDGLGSRCKGCAKSLASERYHARVRPVTIKCPNKGGWKLTDAQKEDICRRYLNGQSIPVIASELNVAVSTVWRVLRKRNEPIRRHGDEDLTRRRFGRLRV